MCIKRRFNLKQINANTWIKNITKRLNEIKTNLQSVAFWSYADKTLREWVSNSVAVTKTNVDDDNKNDLSWCQRITWEWIKHMVMR